MHFVDGKLFNTIIVRNVQVFTTHFQCYFYAYPFLYTFKKKTHIIKYRLNNMRYRFHFDVSDSIFFALSFSNSFFSCKLTQPVPRSHALFRFVEFNLRIDCALQYLFVVQIWLRHMNYIFVCIRECVGV